MFVQGRTDIINFNYVIFFISTDIISVLTYFTFSSQTINILNPTASARWSFSFHTTTLKLLLPPYSNPSTCLVQSYVFPIFYKICLVLKLEFPFFFLFFESLNPSSPSCSVLGVFILPPSPSHSPCSFVRFQVWCVLLVLRMRLQFFETENVFCCCIEIFEFWT